MPLVGKKHWAPKYKFIDLYAFVRGDMSVGVPHQEWAIHDIGPMDDYEEQREEVRKAFTIAFEVLVNSKVRIRFSDEKQED